MELITKEIEEKLKSHPLDSTADQGVVDVLVKFYNPFGRGTWYVFEGEKFGEDWEFFGLVDLFTTELGYFTLSELEAVRQQFGIERDPNFNKKYNYKTGEFE